MKCHLRLRSIEIGVGNRNNGEARRIEMTDRLIDRARSPIRGVRTKRQREREEQQTFKSTRVKTRIPTRRVGDAEEEEEVPFWA